MKLRLILLLFFFVVVSSQPNSWTTLLSSTPLTGRNAHASVLVPDSGGSLGTMYVVGGLLNNGTTLGEMWSYSLNTSTWSLLSILSTPRSYPGMTLNPSINCLIVYGGRRPVGTYASQMYLFNLTANKWNGGQVNQTNTPGSRAGHALFHSTANGFTYLFGGYDATISTNSTFKTFVSDMFVTWTALNLTYAPSNRGYFQFANTGTDLFLYGGESNDTAVVTFLSETWKFSTVTETWTQLTPGGVNPGLLSRGSGAYSSTTNSFLMFGGTDGVSLQNSIYYYDIANNRWARVSPLGTPPTSRQFLSQVYEPINNLMIFYGGIDENSTTYDDLWSYSVAIPQFTTGEQTTSEQTTRELTTGEVTTGERTTGEVTTGEVTTGEVTTGEVTTGEITTGERTTGEVTTLAVSQTISSKKNSSTMLIGIIVGSVGGVFLIVVVVVVVVLVLKRKKPKAKEESGEEVPLE